MAILMLAVVPAARFYIRTRAARNGGDPKKSFTAEDAEAAEKNRSSTKSRLSIMRQGPGLSVAPPLGPV